MAAPTISVETCNYEDTNSPSKVLTFPYIHDNNGALYSYVEDGTQYDLMIRHSTENRRAGFPVMQRHYIGVTVTEAPSELYPQGKQVQGYMILRSIKTEDQENVRQVLAAVSRITGTNLGAIMNGQGIL